MEEEKKNNDLADYVNKNAKEIIDYLIKLIEYQENISIEYKCKKK